MDIKVEKAYSLHMNKDYLLCGCAEGVVRVFQPKTLEHVLTLPKPPPLGTANISTGVKRIRIPSNKESHFADVKSITIDNNS